jgi:hypothetical protein
LHVSSGNKHWEHPQHRPAGSHEGEDLVTPGGDFFTQPTMDCAGLYDVRLKRGARAGLSMNVRLVQHMRSNAAHGCGFTSHINADEEVIRIT